MSRTSEWRISSNYDSFRFAEFNQFLLTKVNMAFNLWKNGSQRCMYMYLQFLLNNKFFNLNGHSGREHVHTWFITGFILATSRILWICSLLKLDKPICFTSPSSTQSSIAWNQTKIIIMFIFEQNKCISK